MTSQPLKGAALLSSTYGHSPERETWSEAHDRLLREEAIERVRQARVPALRDAKPSRVSPVFIIGVVLVVLVVGILVVSFGWKPVVIGIFCAFVLVVIAAWILERPMSEAERVNDLREAAETDDWSEAESRMAG